MVKLMLLSVSRSATKAAYGVREALHESLASELRTSGRQVLRRQGAQVQSKRLSGGAIARFREHCTPCRAPAP